MQRGKAWQAQHDSDVSSNSRGATRSTGENISYAGRRHSVDSTYYKARDVFSSCVKLAAEGVESSQLMLLNLDSSRAQQSFEQCHVTSFQLSDSEYNTRGPF